MPAPTQTTVETFQSQLTSTARQRYGDQRAAELSGQLEHLADMMRILASVELEPIAGSPVNEQSQDRSEP